MIKEIWCMPHSHLDIGYTHPQPILMELQVDYLNQALELTEKQRTIRKMPSSDGPLKPITCLRNG